MSDPSDGQSDEQILDLWDASEVAVGPRLMTLAEQAKCRAERVRLREALTDLLNDCGIEFDDERLDYLVIQVDRRAWNAARAALDGSGKARPEDSGAPPPGPIEQRADEIAEARYGLSPRSAPPPEEKKA